MVLKRALKLLWLFSVATLRAEWAYRGSFAFEALTSLVYVGISLLFWRIVYTKTTAVAGWSLGGIYTLLGFAELFWALQRGIMSGAFWIPGSIQLGHIERWLASPVDPRFGIMLQHMQPFMFLRSLPSVVVWLTLGATHGVGLTVYNLTLGVASVFVAAIAMTMIIICMGSIAFWLGQAEALGELCRVLSDWARWPTDVFAMPVRLVLTYVLPIALAATLPASVVRRSGSSGLVLTLGILLVLFWAIVQEALWRQGLARYEGYGG